MNSDAIFRNWAGEVFWVLFVMFSRKRLKIVGDRIHPLIPTSVVCNVVTIAPPQKPAEFAQELRYFHDAFIKSCRYLVLVACDQMPFQIIEVVEQIQLLYFLVMNLILKTCSVVIRLAVVLRTTVHLHSLRFY